jgi:hypothetical protein
MVPVETCACATLRIRDRNNKTLATVDVVGINILH